MSYDIKYGVVAFLMENPSKIVHFEGYTEPPSMGDISELKQNLIKEDTLGELAHRLQFRFASTIEVDFVNFQLNQK